MSGGVRRLSWRFIPSSPLMSRPARARYTTTKPVVESLEGRQLLALFTGFSHVRNIPTNSGVYSLQIDGPGVLKTQPAGGGSFDVKVLGTTNASTLTITQVRPRFHVVNGPMSIDNLTIRSGQIGSILASPVELDGAMSPVNSGMNTLEFGALGRGARIDVNGGVNTMDVGSVGSGAQIDVSGSVGTMDVGFVESGAIDVSGNVSTMNVGSVGSGAQIDVNGSVGTMNVGSVNLGPSGHVVITGNLNSLTVTGNLLVNPGSEGIVVGGNLNGLTVNGIFQGQGTSAIDLSVGLDLTNFTVLSGSSNLGGVRSANIAVGKDIVGLNIQHGIFNSLITAGVLIDGSPQNSSSGGNIGPDGSDAIFDSEILAGVQINNMLINGNVTSDYVTNPKPNPTGYPTRIVAGEVLEDRAPGRDPQGGFPQGTFTSAGNIDNFQITGSLIDSVLAASVAPFGGNGTFPSSPYGAQPPSVANTPGDQGFNTYDAPYGLIEGGKAEYITGTLVPGSVQVQDQNYSEASYFNETPFSRNGNFPQGDYDKSIDPTIDDAILPGSINLSFATAPASIPVPVSLPITTPISVTLSLPSKSTVLGGVISHQHNNGNPDANDFAGIFAADTSGVFVGALPTS